jgi:hypothetical protein
MSPAAWLARRERKTCRWATSWATRATWANTMAMNAATANCHQESPSTTKATQPPA